LTINDLLFGRCSRPLCSSQGAEGSVPRVVACTGNSCGRRRSTGKRSWRQRLPVPSGPNSVPTASVFAVSRFHTAQPQYWRPSPTYAELVSDSPMSDGTARAGPFVWWFARSRRPATVRSLERR